jgi:cell division protein FtsB
VCTATLKNTPEIATLRRAPPALKEVKDQQDARVAALEQRNTELEARVLELEASRAATSKVQV